MIFHLITNLLNSVSFLNEENPVLVDLQDEVQLASQFVLQVISQVPLHPLPQLALHDD